MTDKEVGEFWHHLLNSLKEDDHICPNDILPLIRKLVEERQKWFPGRSLEMALRDFGIDPETFK